MNLFLIIFLVFLHILLSCFLCFIILLQKPEGTISVASNKNQSSRSENVVLTNFTIVLSMMFFLLSASFNIYSEKVKQNYNVTYIPKN